MLLQEINWTSVCKKQQTVALNINLLPQFISELVLSRRLKTNLLSDHEVSTQTVSILKCISQNA